MCTYSPQTVDVRKYTEKVATGDVDDELVARIVDATSDIAPT